MKGQKITVIIPVYNGYKYIDRCLRSIINQRIADLDIIAVDDGSTDGSGDLLDKWASGDNRIHVLHINNMGVSAARNAGIKLAAGNNEEGYIHFIDVDDELYPDCYSDLTKNICELEVKPDIIVFGYTTNYVDIEGKSVRKEVTTPKIECLICDEDIQNKYFEFYGIRTGLRNSVCNKLFKISVCMRIEFDQSLKQAEDLFFNIDAIGLARSIYFDDNSYYQYNKSVEEKAYYDSDVQMAYDRNKFICDRIISIGVNQKKAKDEYYHKVIDTAYDYCMLLLRTKPKNEIQLIHEALEKLRRLNLPTDINRLTLQQKVILLAMKLHNKIPQYIFLMVVKQSIKMLR